MTRMTIAAAALLAVLAAQADLSHAQAAWPSKPIKLIVPFPPGGGSDPVARVIAQGLSTRLGERHYVGRAEPQLAPLSTERIHQRP